MFDQFKAFGQLAALMKDKDRLKAAAEEFRAKLDRISVTGTSGGGAVRVTMNGQLRVTDVFLDPALVAGLQHGDSGRTMAQSLIMDAMNDASERARAIVGQEAQRHAKELGLPDMPGLQNLLG
ncbi:MAG TPA: YbaB/EbfC family nucleoid-associated protein [Phycisphaerales bacterium]|nr:YbaB/EbfC family nucleoid-associated protein [Phycisphaerales bacterium]